MTQANFRSKGYLGLWEGWVHFQPSRETGQHEGMCLNQGFMAAMKHHDQKASWEGKGLFGLHFHAAVHLWRKSRQELKQERILEAGTDTEAMEGAAYWLASHGLLNLFSYKTQDHQPRDGTTYYEQGPTL